MFATAKKISSTLLPGTFDVFKDDISQTRQMGREGADARILVAHKYEDVALLALLLFIVVAALLFPGGPGTPRRIKVPI